MFRVIIAALLAAVVLFGWGFVYWTILPTSKSMLAPLMNGDAVAQEVLKSNAHSGTYFYPMPPEVTDDPEAAKQAFVQRRKAGPLMQISLRVQGHDPTDPLMYVEGFVYQFASALLAGALLAFTLPALPTYGTRVIFVALLGGFAALLTRLSDVIWLQHPWEFEVYSSAYLVSSWLLAGIVLAAFIRPTPVKKLA
jgi:hypothetical protein